MTNPEVKIRLALDGAGQVQAGVDRAAASLDKLGAAGAKVGQKTQLSGQQIAQVSAQLQDLFVQIQGGGAPLTALLQQGSQLSAVFGGTGNALRAVTSLISPAVAGLGALAATAAATALAYKQGSAEQDAYLRAIVLTGNAAGVTAGELQRLAAAQDRQSGTQSQAAEVLAQLVASGRVAREVLSGAADAAIRLERAGGPAAEATGKKLADLGKEPLQALIKLDEAEGFLTASLYKRVKALQDSGQAQEAARAAQEGYLSALNGRTAELEQNLGSIERAWRGVTTTAKEAWDAMLDVGRPDDPIAKAEQAVVVARGKTKSIYRSAEDFEDLGAAEIRLNDLRRQQQIVREMAASEAAALAVERERVKLGETNTQWLSKQAQQAQELAAAQTEGQKRIAAGLITQTDLERRLADIRAKYADRKGESAAEAARRQALQDEATALARINGLSGDYQRQLDAINRLQEKGAINAEKAAAARRSLAADQPAAREEARQVEAISKEWADTLQAYEAYLAKLNQGGDQAEARTAQLRLEAEAGKLAAESNISLAAAIEEVAIARLLDKRDQSANKDEIAALDSEIAKRRELRKVIQAQDDSAAAADQVAAASKRLDEFLDPGKAQDFGEALTRAFDGAGNSLAKLSSSLQDYARQQARLAQTRVDIAVEKDPAKKLAAQLKLNQDAQKSQISLYAGMAGAAKGFFDEGSKGYKALETAETAFRAYQLAGDLIRGLSAAKVAIATQAGGDPYTAWIRMAAMAAAMATLGFAVSGGFASGPTTGGDGRPVNTGTGTVLGDAEAQSESIANAIERLADTSQLQLSTQSGMLAALRNIENTIGGITGLVLRGRETRGSVANQFGISEGLTVNGSTQIALEMTVPGYNLDKLLGGRITNALFGSKTRITGNGLFADAQSLGSILGQGLSLQDYADVNSSRKFLGIKVSNKNSTSYQDADPVLQQQFGLVFRNFAEALKLAANPLDQSLDEVTSRLNSFVVDIGKIDLSGLTGEQIQERLSAVLGAAGDRIAEAAIPGLQAFQNVGEGYFETVVRVASGVETAQAALELLGIGAINFTDITRKQGDVAAEIVRQSIAGFESLDGSLSSVGAIINTLDGGAEDITEAYSALVDVRDALMAVGASGDSLTTAMIRSAGGLDQLQTGLSDYLENFFSDDERKAAGTVQLQGQFDRLGLGDLPESREAFRAIAESIDTTTTEGQKLFAQLVGLSGAFAELVPATEGLGESAAEAAVRMAEAGQRVLNDLAKQREQLEVQLLRAQGNGGAADARARELALTGLSPADSLAAGAAYDFNRALEAQIALLNEAARASEQAAQAEQQRLRAVASERAGLERRLLEAQGDTAAIRALELAALDATNRVLLERLFVLEDVAAAEALAQQALDATLQRESAIASERDGLQQQLLQLQGDTAALRQIELNALDASNQALQRRIFALQDEQAEADRLAAVAAQGNSLQVRVEQLLGQTAELRARELAALDPVNRGLQLLIFELEDAAVAAQEAARIQQQRSGLESRLLQAQGDTAALRALELAGLDASNRALLERIFALEDAAALEAEAAQRAQAIAAERSGLESRLLQAQGDTAALRALELAGLDASNRALLERIFALEDAAALEAEAAQRAQAIAAERSGLESRLLQAQGDTAALRALELAALDPSNRALQQQINLLEDQQAAAAQAAQALERFSGVMSQLGDTRFDLENQLLELQGRGADALARTRERDLARLTEGKTPEQIAAITAAYDLNQALKDQVAAQQAANSAAQEAAQAAEQLRQAWTTTADSLVEEAARLRGQDATGQESIASLQSRFAIATAQARAGDVEAAGTLPELGRSLAELQIAAATDRLDLARIRAQIASSLETTAEIARRQGGQAGAAPNPVEQAAAAIPELLQRIAEGAAVLSPTATAARDEQTRLQHDALVAEVRGLRATVEALQEPSNRTARASEQTRDVLTQVTENGRAMQTEVLP
jgi:hypothetical protein